MMQVEEVLHRLEEEAALEAVKHYWDESQAAFPTGGIDFLQPEQVRANLLACGFGAHTFEQALRAAAKIQADPALAALIWHCAWRVYESHDEHWFSAWPRLDRALGEDAGVFNLLVGIAMAPRVYAHHQRMGIPADVTRDTCLEPYAFSLNYAEMSGGRLGIPMGQLFWLRYYTREKYFRLGRYEFWLKRFDWKIPIFRSSRSGQVLALAPHDVGFDAQGFYHRDLKHEESEGLPPRSGEKRPLSGEWRSRLVEEPGRITGSPIDPRGFALRQPVTLDLAEWQPALQPGDWVLDMHIPAGGGMAPEVVQDSFRRAAEFFPRHFPETPPKALMCWSWIYNPGLAEFLPPQSNLVRNLSDAYLIPVDSDPEDGLGFVFYQDKFDAATAPRKTSLQRAVLDYLARGGRWRCGSMFYLMEDIDRLGSAVYQAQ
jgi:hypothetical protein